MLLETKILKAYGLNLNVTLQNIYVFFRRKVNSYVIESKIFRDLVSGGARVFAVCGFDRAMIFLLS